jgi:hypothetical protein
LSRYILVNPTLPANDALLTQLRHASGLQTVTASVAMAGPARY